MQIESANRRTGQLKRFLAKPPKGAAALRLATDDADCPAVLSRWEKGQAVPELALEIEGSVSDHADETGSYVTARLEWLNKDSQVLTTKMVRGRPSEEAGLDGSQPSQAAQAQRHLEAMTRLYVSAHGQTIERLNGLVSQLAEITSRSLEQARVASEDAEVARANAAEAIREADQAELESGSQAGERVMKLAEVALMGSLQGGGGGKPPAA